MAEERRLLYVAMTRAQSFLTLTYVATRMMGGEENEREVSSFVASSLRKDPVGCFWGTDADGRLSSPRRFPMLTSTYASNWRPC